MTMSLSWSSKKLDGYKGVGMEKERRFKSRGIQKKITPRRTSNSNCWKCDEIRTEDLEDFHSTDHYRSSNHIEDHKVQHSQQKEDFIARLNFHIRLKLLHPWRVFCHYILFLYYQIERRHCPEVHTYIHSIIWREGECLSKINYILWEGGGGRGG